MVFKLQKNIESAGVGIMGTKFTPGPWHYRPQYGTKGLAFYEIYNDEETIASTWLTNHEPNAHLLAAAPEMYNALEILINTISETFEDVDLTKYRDILKKARGE